MRECLIINSYDRECTQVSARMCVHMYVYMYKWACIHPFHSHASAFGRWHICDMEKCMECATHSIACWIVIPNMACAVTKMSSLTLPPLPEGFRKQGSACCYPWAWRGDERWARARSLCGALPHHTSWPKVQHSRRERGGVAKGQSESFGELMKDTNYNVAGFCLNRVKSRVMRNHSRVIEPFLNGSMMYREVSCLLL
jgi:hypothetical protein